MTVRDPFQTGRAALPCLAAILFFVTGAMAETTNYLSDAEIQGRNLAQQLLEQQPAANFSQTGVLKIRSSNSPEQDIPMDFETEKCPPGWRSLYRTRWLTTKEKNEITFTLVVTHDGPNLNSYELSKILLPSPSNNLTITCKTNLTGAQIMTPFAGSDFWVADLGLEFFHWPEQKVLKHEMRRSRACKVLESTNPNPSANGYARVVSWIDNESSGIVHADAYDASGRLLKQFDPKSFKKINGQWELQEMEIRNVQTGSRTRLEFDLKPK